MSAYNGIMETLHEQLTSLLMENGAAVTKKSIDELIQFIARRDQSIINWIIKDNEKVLRQLQDETRVNDLELKDD